MEPVKTIKYLKTQIYRSELDFTRFQGQFQGGARQTVTLYCPDKPTEEMPVRCDVEITLGGPEDPMLVEVLVASFFLPESGTSDLTDEEARFCEYTAAQKAVDVVAQLSQLHIGRSIHLPVSEPPQKA